MRHNLNHTVVLISLIIVLFTWVAKLNASETEYQMIMAEKAGIDSTLGRLYFEKHIDFTFIDPPKAIQYLKKSASHYERAKMDSKRSDPLAKIGQLYNTMGLNHLALEYLFEAYGIISKEDNDQALAWLLSDIGNVYYGMQQIDIAESYYNRGKELMVKHKNRYGESVMINNVALCNASRNDLKGAKRLFEKALRLRMQEGEQYPIYHSISMLAALYSRMGDEKKAEDLYLTIYKDLINPVDKLGASEQLRGSAAIGLSSIYNAAKQHDKALRYLDAAIEIFKNLGDSYSYHNSLSGKAIHYRDKGNYAEAIKLMKMVYDDAKVHNNPVQLKDTAYLLTDLCLRLGDHRSAQTSFLTYATISDSLYATRAPEGLVNLHSVVQNHIKELENQELVHRQRIITRFLILTSLLAAISLFFYLRYLFAGKKHLKRLRQLADASFEGILIHNDGIILDVNNRLLELFEIQREDCIGKGIEEITKFPVSEDIIKRSQDGEILNYEIQIERKSGVMMDIEVMSRPFTYGKKKVRVAAIRDITEKKHFITSIIETQAQLRELNVTKDRLFSIIAHDLKNPFNGIIGFTDLMRRDISRFTMAQIVEMVNLIHESSTSAYSLAQHLLDWARLQTGAIKCKPETFTLLSFLESSISLLKPIASAKAITIYTECNPDIEIFADPKMLQMIVNNILTNSLKFTPHRGFIQIDADSEDGTILTICDNGIGMDQQTLTALFQIDKIHSRSGTDNEAGTGLGLILCKEMVELHGGRISVNSTEGKGTCFRMHFPKP